MKITVFGLWLAVVMGVLLAACVGNPEPEPSPEPAVAAPPPVVQPPPPVPVVPTPPPPVVQQPPPGDPFTRHPSGIILNGAADYTVARGDTLSRIAGQFYQDGSYYPLILIVSDGAVANPDLIEPGMRLTIPALKENLEDGRAKEILNRSLLESAVFEDQQGRHTTAELMRDLAGTR